MTDTTEDASDGIDPSAAPSGPGCHPADQTTPGPADRVPADWQRRLN